jgi:hypothetical protein
MGWVNLCLLSFCYLEWRRQLLRRGGQRKRPYWQAARAQALRGRLRREVEQVDVEALLRTARSARGRKRLSELLRCGYADPVATTGRQRRA